MVSWSAGLKEYDGVWAKHWYPSVLNSTSFIPESKKHIELSENEKTLIDEYGYNEYSAEEILTYASNNLWRDS